MKVIITVGLGFGDEGKGATIDWLARETNASLVVRYSGGAQAGHNVELPCGRRHTFSQFGAASLAGVPTYLGPRMIVCPMTLEPEADHLRQLGVTDPWSMMTVHPECLISTSYHIAMNRLRERSRGDRRHGSCGLGIGEARHYWLRYGQDAIVAADLRDRSELARKLTLLRERFRLVMQTLDRIDPKCSAELRFVRPSDEADELMRAANSLSLSSAMPEAETVLMEGSQGVLLDEWYGFHPYTTWSTVTAEPALEMLSDHPTADITLLGITRAYSTRHGAGPFPAHCCEMTRHMTDRGNPANDWQGSLRFGPLDRMQLRYAARICHLDGIVVTCLDQLSDRCRITERYEEMDELPIPATLKEQEALTDQLTHEKPVYRDVTRDALLDSIAEIAPIAAIASGPTHMHRQWANGSIQSDRSFEANQSIGFDAQRRLPSNCDAVSNR